MDKFRIASVLRFFGCFIFVLSSAMHAGAQQVPGVTDGADQAGMTQRGIDEPARLYVSKCFGCHTIGAGKLDGPDLVGVSTWPKDNLRDAIRKMEERVGPLASEELDMLLGFLQHKDRIARLRTEQERITLERAVSFEPGSVITGEALFTGEAVFANGGLGCVSCHNAGANGGGNFAADLTDAFERMGELPLLSACENTSYPVMRASYALRPILRQEAIHLVAYLKSVSEDKTTPSNAGQATVLWSGSAIAALFMAAACGVYRLRNRGVRSQLVSEAIKRNNP